jgi:ubiquinone biosynthesis protein
VLSRFGPRLPELAEAALTREAQRSEMRPEPAPSRKGLYITAGAALALAGFILGRLI